MSKRPELRTKNGYNLFDVSSVVQKACRRGDAKNAVFFTLELYPAYTKYLWKRLLTVAAEDCTYSLVTQEVMACYQAFWELNYGKLKNPSRTTYSPLTGQAEDCAGLQIVKAVLLLCYCQHNRDSDYACCFAPNMVTPEEVQKALAEATETAVDIHLPPIPEYTFDIHTRAGKQAGKTEWDFFKAEEEELANHPPLFEHGKQTQNQLSLFEGFPEAAYPAGGYTDKTKPVSA